MVGEPLIDSKTKGTDHIMEEEEGSSLKKIAIQTDPVLKIDNIRTILEIITNEKMGPEVKTCSIILNQISSNTENLNYGLTVISVSSDT